MTGKIISLAIYCLQGDGCRVGIVQKKISFREDGFPHDRILAKSLLVAGLQRLYLQKK